MSKICEVISKSFNYDHQAGGFSEYELDEYTAFFRDNAPEVGESAAVVMNYSDECFMLDVTIYKSKLDVDVDEIG